MNSLMYGSRSDQATWFLLHAIGVIPASVKETELRVAIVRQNYQFLAGLRAGELVAVRSALFAVRAKYVRFIYHVIDIVTARMVATSDCTAVLARPGIRFDLNMILTPTNPRQRRRPSKAGVAHGLPIQQSPPKLLTLGLTNRRVSRGISGYSETICIWNNRVDRMAFRVVLSRRTSAATP